MYRDIGVTIEEGDPFGFKVIESGIGNPPVVKVYIGGRGVLDAHEVTMSARSLVALQGVVAEAVAGMRTAFGEARWAELFPPELDLGVKAATPAAYLFSGPEGSWATRVREVAGDGVPVLDCHVNNGVDAVRSMLSSTGPVVLDGVHMLSAAAANALFTALNGRSSTPIILTTTDPAKVLPSIRAHCQHENTGRMAA